MRFNYDTIATKQDLSYTGNKGSYSGSAEFYGFFSPIDSDENVIALGIVGQAYQFVTEGTADIEATDILTINSEEYRVRGVRRNRMKRQDKLTCIMEKPSTD